MKKEMQEENQIVVQISLIKKNLIILTKTRKEKPNG